MEVLFYFRQTDRNTHTIYICAPPSISKFMDLPPRYDKMMFRNGMIRLTEGIQFQVSTLSTSKNDSEYKIKSFLRNVCDIGTR